MDQSWPFGASWHRGCGLASWAGCCRGCESASIVTYGLSIVHLQVQSLIPFLTFQFWVSTETLSRRRCLYCSRANKFRFAWPTGLLMVFWRVNSEQFIPSTTFWMMSSLPIYLFFPMRDYFQEKKQDFLRRSYNSLATYVCSVPSVQGLTVPPWEILECHRLLGPSCQDPRSKSFLFGKA